MQQFRIPGAMVYVMIRSGILDHGSGHGQPGPAAAHAGQQLDGRIGSLMKTFTTTVILQFGDQHKLLLDDR